MHPARRRHADASRDLAGESRSERRGDRRIELRDASQVLPGLEGKVVGQPKVSPDAHAAAAGCMATGTCRAPGVRSRTTNVPAA